MTAPGIMVDLAATEPEIGERPNVVNGHLRQILTDALPALLSRAERCASAERLRVCVEAGVQFYRGSDDKWRPESMCSRYEWVCDVIGNADMAMPGQPTLDAAVDAVFVALVCAEVVLGAGNGWEGK